VILRHISFPPKCRVIAKRDPYDKSKWTLETVQQITMDEAEQMTRNAIAGMYGEYTKLRAQKVLTAKGVLPAGTNTGRVDASAPSISNAPREGGKLVPFRPRASA